MAPLSRAAKTKLPSVHNPSSGSEGVGIRHTVHVRKANAFLTCIIYGIHMLTISLNAYHSPNSSYYEQNTQDQLEKKQAVTQFKHNEPIYKHFIRTEKRRIHTYF